MQGQQLYIPGYGFASVEDVCGGCTGRPWIDLGYSDHDFETWHSWVTVYFLTPVPTNIIYVLE
jgi:3D (Asp-Asp-Asp) domain-containing protein